LRFEAWVHLRSMATSFDISQLYRSSLPVWQGRHVIEIVISY
jgi:hypothetical protein